MPGQDRENSVNQPECPDGHGPMERLAGYWALSGVDRLPPKSLLGEPEFTLNGKGSIVKMWFCSTCKQARLYADDTEE